MCALFQPYDTVDTRQVIDHFENHFLKSVFRAAAGKSLAKAIDKPDLISKRKTALLAAIDVLLEVREKGLGDNPEDKERIIEASNKALDTAIETVPKIAPDDEGDTVEIFQNRCRAAKLSF